ncbi:hypothetical protein DPEC_G00028610 [Dallia pectoralis]|uniref:Uncharacterized protein n=1 Tax=Dallia pectoralis TaxID=75939 RepID=A0ACC2HI73_DALPE|nr:hypothetical protein DPEC_G00028610 [Dallia pectoralis]
MTPRLEWYRKGHLISVVTTGGRHGEKGFLWGLSYWHRKSTWLKGNSVPCMTRPAVKLGFLTSGCPVTTVLYLSTRAQCLSVLIRTFEPGRRRLTMY